MPDQIQSSENRSRLWCIVGILSSIVGLVCYAWSSSFKYLFGEWKFYKLLLYIIISLIICGMVLFAKKIQVSSSFRLKAHVGFCVLMLTSLYSFFYDKAVKGSPDALSIISYAALALMSLCFSRKFELGFEVGLFYFFLGCLITQLMKIHFILVVLGAVFSYALIMFRSYSDSQVHIGATRSGENLEAIRIDPANGVESSQPLPSIGAFPGDSNSGHNQENVEVELTEQDSVSSGIQSDPQSPRLRRRFIFAAQRCQKPGCNKGSESHTAFCKAHGGGKRCQFLGCTKSAEGKTDYCIAHGGGKRCGFPDGCTRTARGKSGLCIRHGGGKRCKIEGCTRSAEGLAGLCISHGGGRRCQYREGCTKGAQGSTIFCKAHGGGKRCSFAGCTKGAEGSTPLCKAHGGGKRCLFNGGGICPKSVHGGTNFCVAHGGGKRCSVPGCTNSARGRTDCCVRHGGGKRCKFEGCGKSAHGSTDFCKAHGGGKRCIWGEGKCEKFARGKSGLCAAHSSLMQERETNKGSLIAPRLSNGLEPPATASIEHSSENNNSSSGS